MLPIKTGLCNIIILGKKDVKFFGHYIQWLGYDFDSQRPTITDWLLVLIQPMLYLKKVNTIPFYKNFLAYNKEMNSIADKNIFFISNKMPKELGFDGQAV